MSVTIPNSISGVVVYEYAATNISFNRQVINIDGSLVGIFTANIAYAKMGYLEDINNKKIAIVSTGNQMAPNANSEDSGNIYLDSVKVAEYFSVAAETNKSIGDIISDLADGLIRKDLITRGIITA